MSSVFREILIIFLLILANGVFSMSEIAIVSARPVRLQQLANQGNEKAEVALDLADSPNRFLSTVQIGMSLVSILTGAFGGATISDRLAAQLNQIPTLAAYSKPLSFSIVVLIITYFSLIIGELVPKRLALNSSESIATSIAVPMRWLSTVTAPIVYLLSLSTDLILKLLGSQSSEEPDVTEEEIKLLIEQGKQSGTIEEEEQNIVSRVFELGDRQVRSLMTPRPDIFWLDIEDSPEENRHKISQSIYSTILICKENLDQVLGFIQVTDLLAQTLSDQPLDLTTPLRRPFFAPETTSILKILEFFKEERTHFALIVDEYGVIQGIVTLNDILFKIVGDIPSLNHVEPTQINQREDGSWLLDGMLSIEEFLELFELQEQFKKANVSYQTLGGLIITTLGRIPNVAEHFEWNHLKIEVMDMDGNRVDKVLVYPLEQPSEAETNEESESS